MTDAQNRVRAGTLSRLPATGATRLTGLCEVHGETASPHLFLIEGFNRFVAIAGHGHEAEAT